MSHVQSLESRCLLTGNPGTFWSQDQYVGVWGASKDTRDVIVVDVTFANKKLKFTGSINGSKFSFEDSQINELGVKGFGYQDTITVTSHGLDKYTRTLKTVQDDGTIKYVTVQGLSIWVDSGAGDDKVKVDTDGGTNYIDLGIGNDTGTIGDRYHKTDLRAFMYGNTGNDTLQGGKYDDALAGGAGNDKISGGSGNDSLYGDDGADKIYGNDGNDEIFGGYGADSMWGGNGNDTFVAWSLKPYGDESKDGSKLDEIWGDSGTDHLWKRHDAQSTVNGGIRHSIEFVHDVKVGV